MPRAPLVVALVAAHVLLAADKLVIWVTVAVVFPAHHKTLLSKLCKYSVTAKHKHCLDMQNPALMSMCTANQPQAAATAKSK